MKLLKRFPAFPQVLSVYAVIAFMLFTWCILWFFWNLTSWLNFMDLGMLLATFSYAMLVSFLEGLTALALLLVFLFILPASSFKDHFVAPNIFL